MFCDIEICLSFKGKTSLSFFFFFNNVSKYLYSSMKFLHGNPIFVIFSLTVLCNNHVTVLL